MNAAVVGLWVLVALVGLAILRGRYTAVLARINWDLTILRTMPPGETITELDIADPLGAELNEYPSTIYPEAYDASVAAYEYWLEVQDCCGGRDRTCGHAR